MKIIDKTRLDDSTSRLLSREISCMERLCHNNLVKLFEVHETFSRLCLVMECASEGDLQSRVEDKGPVPEVQAKDIFSQLAAGINHMVSGWNIVSEVLILLYCSIQMELPTEISNQRMCYMFQVHV